MTIWLGLKVPLQNYRFHPRGRGQPFPTTPVGLEIGNVGAPQPCPQFGRFNEVMHGKAGRPRREPLPGDRPWGKGQRPIHHQPAVARALRRIAAAHRTWRVTSSRCKLAIEIRSSPESMA